MADAQVEETLESLLRAARNAGVRVSRDQLRRWQREGLIPRPRQRGRGRGLGTEVLYPPGSTRQLVRLCELRKQMRSHDAIGWALWWEGFPIAESRIQAQLERQLTFAERTRAAVKKQLIEWELDEDRDLVGVLERVAQIRLAPELGAIRRRTRRAKFATFIGAILRTFAGFPADLTKDDDASIVARGFGLRDPTEAGPTLKGAAAILDPRKLRRALGSATFAEICAARDDVCAVLDVLGAVNAFVALTMGRGPAPKVLETLASPSPADGSHMVLLWLAAKNLPQAREVYEGTLARLRSISAGTLSAEEAFKDD